MPLVTYSLEKPTFGLEGDPKRYQDEELQRLALNALEGKTPPADGKPNAIVYWGPPRSGKTTHAQALLTKLESEGKSYVYSSSDEFGGIESIKTYREQNERLGAQWTKGLEALRAAQEQVNGLPQEQQDAALAEKRAALEKLHQERLKLHEDFAPDSRVIRGHALNEAVHRKLNVIIDMTSSGKSAVDMIDRLHEQGYSVEYQGLIASSPAAETRDHENARKAIAREDVFSKRVATLETLPTLVKKADSFTLSINDRNGAEPREVMAWQAGQAVRANDAALDEVRALLANDLNHYRTHADETVRNRQDALAAAVNGVFDQLPEMGKPLFAAQSAQRQPGAQEEIPGRS